MLRLHDPVPFLTREAKNNLLQWLKFVDTTRIKSIPRAQEPGSSKATLVSGEPVVTPSSGSMEMVCYWSIFVFGRVLTLSCSSGMRKVRFSGEFWPFVRDEE